jgi:hypothetical protein
MVDLRATASQTGNKQTLRGAGRAEQVEERKQTARTTRQAMQRTVKE